MNILITGGHSGMGLELTKKLLGEGHHVGLIVRSDKRKAEAEQLLSNHDKLDVFVADLSDRDAIATVAERIAAAWPRLDGIFNNAGLLLDQLYYADNGNELHLEVNGISPYLLTKALKPLLDKAEKPFVVNTATGSLNQKKSISVPLFKRPKKFTKLMGSYMDSKLIMVLLMNYLAKEWPDVRIVSVNPGAIKTKMTAGNGMPKWLLPIRHLMFKSPAYGANSLYKGAFDQKIAGTGIYVSENKVKPMAYTIKADEIRELLA